MTGLRDTSEVEIDWQFLLLVTIIAFLVRFLYIFTLEQSQFYFDDSHSWNQIALNILALSKRDALKVSIVMLALLCVVISLWVAGHSGKEITLRI